MQPDAEKKFLQIKAAYQTLVDANSRAKYDSSRRASPQWDPFSWETESPSSKTSQKEEEFYGLGTLFSLTRLGNLQLGSNLRIGCSFIK